MNRRSFLISGTTLISAALVPAQTAKYKLDVEVNYTGSGKVDDAHKIYVVLWDNADFMSGTPGGPPMSVQTVSSKSETTHFTGLDKSPVFVSMVFDPSGQWDAQSPPPTGSSVGLYSTDPGEPAPVKLDPDKTTKITATFDDTAKV